MTERVKACTFKEVIIMLEQQAFRFFPRGGGRGDRTSLFATTMTWNKMTRFVRKRKNVTRIFFSLSLSQVFSVWYWSKQLLSFLLIYQAFPITMPFVLVNFYTAHEDLTYSKDSISASNYSINANVIVSSSRMKRKYNSWQLRIHSSSLTENW